MWIYLNENATELKVRPLTTYLRTMFKIEEANKPLYREQLVYGKQKCSTLTNHLKDAAKVGLIFKRCANCHNDYGWDNYPKIYTAKDPTWKVCFNRIEDITEAAAYEIQKALGGSHTKHIEKEYEGKCQWQCKLDSVTEEEHRTHLFTYSLTAFGITVNIDNIWYRTYYKDYFTKETE